MKHPALFIAFVGAAAVGAGLIVSARHAAAQTPSPAPTPTPGPSPSPAPPPGPAPAPAPTPEDHSDDIQPTFKGICGTCGVQAVRFGCCGSCGSTAPKIGADARLPIQRLPPRRPLPIAHHPAARYRPGLTWYADVPAAAAALRCVAPSGCHLRVVGRDGRLHPSGVVVENGGVIEALDARPGPKMDPASPSVTRGGWTFARYREPAAGRVLEGWLPSEWLVAA